MEYEDLIQEARDLYQDENIEIDDDAQFSFGNDGTWVSAWVLIPNERE